MVFFYHIDYCGHLSLESRKVGCAIIRAWDWRRWVLGLKVWRIRKDRFGRIFWWIVGRFIRFYLTKQLSCLVWLLNLNRNFSWLMEQRWFGISETRLLSTKVERSHCQWFWARKLIERCLGCWLWRRWVWFWTRLKESCTRLSYRCRSWNKYQDDFFLFV